MEMNIDGWKSRGERERYGEAKIDRKRWILTLEVKEDNQRERKELVRARRTE